jgi:hypothetical protein
MLKRHFQHYFSYNVAFNFINAVHQSLEKSTDPRHMLLTNYFNRKGEQSDDEHRHTSPKDNNIATYNNKHYETKP